MLRRTLHFFHVKNTKYTSLSDLNIANSFQQVERGEFEENHHQSSSSIRTNISFLQHQTQYFEEEEEDYNFLSRSGRSRNNNNSSSSSSMLINVAELQTPDKALRVAESAIASPQGIGYAYAILPIVDIILEAYKRDLLFEETTSVSSIDEDSIANNNNSSNLDEINVDPDDDQDQDPEFEAFFKSRSRQFEKEEPPIWTSQYQPNMMMDHQQQQFDGQHQNNNTNFAVDMFDDKGNKKKKKTAKSQKRIVKQHRKFHFPRWFPVDALTLARNPDALSYTAGSERAQILSKMMMDMLKEYESVFDDKNNATSSFKVPSHLVSASPLTRVMHELGIAGNAAIELPYKKLLRGIAIATCRHDIYLDLPVLSNAIIENDPRLFFVAAVTSAKNSSSAPKNKKENNNNNNNNTTTTADNYKSEIISGHLPSLNAILHEMKLQGKVVSNSVTQNQKVAQEDEGNDDDLPPLFKKLQREELKKSSSITTKDDQESDRALLWVKLLLGVAAEAGSYSCALHAAEILKVRNMQTTMPMQRLMMVSCHAQVRREQDWKFRNSSGLRAFGKKWVNEYFPKIVKK